MNEHAATEIAFKNGYEKGIRQIISDIEEELDFALRSNYEFMEHHDECDDLWHNVNGKINTLRGLQYFIEVLKDRYGVNNYANRTDKT